MTILAPVSALTILKVPFPYNASSLSLKASFYRGPYSGSLITA
jgi:hypothetical protein